MKAADPDAAVLGAFLEEMQFSTLARRIGAAGATPTVRAPGKAPSAPVMTPSFAPQASKAEPGAHKIDVNAYHCIRDLEALDAFIARAYARGLVAFDTETDALSSANANLCGVSLAVAHGEACYIPVGHEHEVEGGLMFDTPQALDQIPCADVIARLK